jgi:hypothetical protein
MLLCSSLLLLLLLLLPGHLERLTPLFIIIVSFNRPVSIGASS